VTAISMPQTGASIRGGVRRVASLDRQIQFGVGIVVVVALVAIVLPFVSPYDPNEVVYENALKGPTAAHWFGSDNLGRDVLSRVADGYRISLVVALGSVAVGLIGGIPLGLLAGYVGGVLDGLVMRPLDVLMAFPAILLAIVVSAILGTGTGVETLAIGIVYVPVIARVMRSSTIAVRREPYIVAARARGASHLRVVLRHVFPNAVGPVIVQASILMGIAILLEAALSFVGLGVRPPTPSLGLMLSDGRDFLSNAPWMMVAPGGAIMLLVLGFNLIGDGLRDALDPRGRARPR
jgi:peptide/nickel transport system permease protein